MNKFLGLNYHTDWRLEKAYAAEGDGVTARVLACRLPAAFYRIEAERQGEEQGAYLTLETGSSQGPLAHAIAKAIAEGMLAKA